MTLAEYLKKNSLSQAKIAAALGTSTATVSRICAGNLRPSLVLAYKIELATRGLVPMNGWLTIDDLKG